MFTNGCTDSIMQSKMSLAFPINQKDWMDLKLGPFSREESSSDPLAS